MSGPVTRTTDAIDLAPARAAAERLAASMTLAEKAGQATQVEKNSITADEVAAFAIGSVLSGSGGNPEPNDPANWRAMVDGYLDGARRSRLGIPLLYGTDSVHGHSNVVGATIFPHNIGLGATGDPDLVEQVYRATAMETAATGARWVFGPTLAVALDPRWGRTYESFGDDPDRVATLGAAAVRGLQGPDPTMSGSTLACLKHYVGDGGTEWDSVAATRAPWIDWWDGWGDAWRIDQGDTRVDEATLRRVHLAPYGSGLDAGALSVMASYNSWNGERLHGHRRLLTEVLKGELGFAGFVVSDWLGIAQLDPDPARCAVLALEAGIDMVMVPFDFRSFVSDVIAAVETGRLDPARLDDAVIRILTVKHALGLFDDRAEPDPPVEVVGSEEHRALARRAVAASAVLLRGDPARPPLTEGPVLVAGAVDDIGLQCGGWTIEWQGGSGAITPGTTVAEGLAQVAPDLVIDVDVDGRFDGRRWGPADRAPVGLVVVAEPPHAEGQGDRADLALPPDDVALIERVGERVDRLVLLVLSGRPLQLDAVVERCDVIVAGWLPGTEGAGLADVLVGNRPFTGRLPRPWPGTGLHSIGSAS